MPSRDQKLSQRVIQTVAEALDEDPLDLPPLEETISAESLDYLFHRKHQPPGAYTLFSYCELWVVVHSNGTVDVFDEWAATSAGDHLPDGVSEPSPDERMVLLFVSGEEYTFYENDLDALHQIITEADDSTEAWEDAIEYAKGR